MNDDFEIYSATDPVPQATQVYVGGAGDPHGAEEAFFRGRWACGFDIGQSRDPTCGAFVQKPDPGVELYRVQHLVKIPLGTPYPEVVDRVGAAFRKLYRLDGDLVVDRSGVGRAPVDELRARGHKVYAVTITGGDSQTRTEKLGDQGENWSVSRSVLMEKIAALAFAAEIRWSPKLALVNDFKRQLHDLQVHYSAAGAERIQPDPKADHHADLIFAVALAIWKLSQPPPPRIQFGRLDLMSR